MHLCWGCISPHKKNILEISCEGFFFSPICFPIMSMEEKCSIILTLAIPYVKTILVFSWLFECMSNKTNYLWVKGNNFAAKGIIMDLLLICTKFMLKQYYKHSGCTTVCDGLLGTRPKGGIKRSNKKWTCVPSPFSVFSVSLV